ncbi:phosphoribosylformylglycinamidine synthase subunit PurQ [Methanosphaerula subterraneus]|uniref:phosphoribosylformylglycinamidine synthase subunit PurQ n=1 Tax=Methanosphaerula subterraneus TaxID=3350244 RepID=UPI003F8648B9
MRFAVVQFGGSNCDLDTYHVLDQVLGVETDLVWYHDDLQKSYDAVVIPGGFSYGDYLRAGAIAARTRIMDQIKEHAAAGGLVLGICNGAQILAESGLIPGIFTRNEDPRFICREALVRVETVNTPFTSAFSTGEVIRLPIAHGEGRFVVDERDYATLKREDRVAFRFCEPDGSVTPSSNPNGSLENITGVLSKDRQVLAMMPHPERASEAVLGSTDGRRIFESMIAYLHR